MRNICKKKVAEHFDHAGMQYVEFHPAKSTFFTVYLVALQPSSDDGLVIILEISTSHGAPHSVELL